MTHFPLILYVIFFCLTALAPLRWCMVSFFLLATIDLGSHDASIGALNTLKAIILPAWLLWRFRLYQGHRKISAVAVLWMLLIADAAIASLASLYPSFALKLVGHMIGSLLICFVLIRATKGGYLTSKIAIPISIGVLAMAAIHWFFFHQWGGETDRFSTFSGPQAFAAMLSALYAAVLASKQITVRVKLPLCAALVVSLVVNGSRMWLIGTVLSSLVFIFCSRFRPVIKAVTLCAMVVAGTLAAGAFDSLMALMKEHSASNRIAATAYALYDGNVRSSGLGTYHLREALLQRSLQAIREGSTAQVLFGHGTCNGVQLALGLNKDPDPNRSMHNEWLRALYEWGVVGFLLWMGVMIALCAYAIGGYRRDPQGNALPLLIYMPAFALGLSGENFFAAAGNVATVGLLMLLALASVSHRRAVSVPRSRNVLRPEPQISSIPLQAAMRRV